MIWDGGIAVVLLAVSDLMTSGRLAVKNKTECLEALDDLAIFKTR